MNVDIKGNGEEGRDDKIIVILRLNLLMLDNVVVKDFFEKSRLKMLFMF